jgi:DNA-binding transcriptional LysR family regulator
MSDWAEFRHFKFLLAIAEYSGFRAAAQHLHTTEPNLSVQAKQFQEMFGIRLFERNQHGRIQLTETGRAFKAIARGLLDHREEALSALIAIEKGEISSLNLGCAPCVVPEVFRVARELHTELLPECLIRPSHGNSSELMDDILSGEIDSAIIGLPVASEELQAVEVRRDRMVVCLRNDHPLASQLTLRPLEMKNDSVILPHPQRNPVAHARMVHFLEGAGISIRDYARASHPSETQRLVKDGFGIGFLREGTEVDRDLTTRPITGVDWTVGTNLVYHKLRHPKTIPVLARHLKNRFQGWVEEPVDHPVRGKRRTRSEYAGAEQLTLLD